MSEQMTLEQAIAVMAACAYKKDANGIVDAWEVIKDHLNAAKVKSGLQPISTAPDKTLVVVAWVDEDQEDRYEFDYKEDGVWIYHNERYEHYSSCAPRDIPCTGPSEEAPYTHWLELPIIDDAMAAQDGGK